MCVIPVGHLHISAIVTHMVDQPRYNYEKIFYIILMQNDFKILLLYFLNIIPHAFYIIIFNNIVINLNSMQNRHNLRHYFATTPFTTLEINPNTKTKLKH